MQDNEISFTKLSEQELLDYCVGAENKALAAHVVVFRHLGINKREAIACMEELVKRKENGSQFNFDEYIQIQLKEMPSPQASDAQKSIFTSLLKTDFTKL